MNFCWCFCFWEFGEYFGFFGNCFVFIGFFGRCCNMVCVEFCVEIGIYEDNLLIIVCIV